MIPIKAVGISAFCAMHSISRSSFYNLKAIGKAPREMRLGARVLITEEAAAEWRQARQSESGETPAGVLLPPELRQKLEGEAAARRISLQDLTLRLIEEAAKRDLLGSLLDQRGD